MIFLKKTIRSMLRHKKAYLSCIVLMAIGVWTYTTMNTALNEISRGKEAYYSDNHLADAFATVSKIPKSAMDDLETIEGVKQVDGRIVEDVRVLLPNHDDEVIRLRVISTIMGENTNRLNGYVQTGNDIQGIEDILVGHDFYEANHYNNGDTITLLMNQKKHEFNIAGYIYSPEYVYIVENEGELFSDTTKFNIAYMDESIMMSLSGMEGAYNDVSFAFEEGYTWDDLKNEIEHKLKPYGIISLYEKDDMFSYTMLEQEIDGGKSMSTTIPMAFVLMAAIVLYLMLKRIIEQDRTQIGTLKAFGYSNETVLFHYISYGLITGVIGAAVGLGISLLSIGPYIQLYLDYYKMPIGTDVADYSYYYIGGFWSVVAGGVGAFFGARSVIKLSPAAAMRPKSPKAIKKDFTHYIPFLKYILTSRGYMTFRNIARNKMRSSFVVLGITFSYSMMVMIGMMSGMMDMMFLNQFRHVLKYDAEVVLNEEIDYSKGIQSIMAYDEVPYAEGILKVPVSVHKGHKKEGTFIIGIKEDTYLYKVYDDDRKVNLGLPKDGIVVGSILANQLDVKKGDYIFVDSLRFDEEQKLYVKDVVNQSLGANAYMDLNLLSDLLGQDLKVNALIIQSEDTNELRRELLDGDMVKKIEDKVQTLALYESLLGSYDFMIFIMQIIAVTIGFTIIYNTAVISLSERSREYATLRVLGLTIQEVKEIMSLEYWILCLIGILLGIPFAQSLNRGLVNMMDIEAFSWPATIPSNAYLIGAIGCILSVLFANITSVRAIRRLDLVEVLKERE